MAEPTEIWLTQTAFDRLTAELTERGGPRRREIATRIGLAREEGDLRENGGYHAAKEDQGKNEARIRQLQHILDNAKIGTPPEAASGKATQGTVVTVRFADGDTDTFLLASHEEARHATLDVCSPTSPLGSAVLDRSVGDTASYELPSGQALSVEIMEVRPYEA